MKPLFAIALQSAEINDRVYLKNISYIAIAIAIAIGVSKKYPSLQTLDPFTLTAYELIIKSCENSFGYYVDVN